MAATAVLPVAAGSAEAARRTKFDALKIILQRLSPTITDQTATCLRNLASFTSTLAQTPYPTRKLAGVLLLLHINPIGELSLTLTTRSLNLRSHPGETALPGGRAEASDPSIEFTALREANEEIGLPLQPLSSLFHLTNLPPFTSRTMLVVIPVVYLLTEGADAILSSLKPNPDEVSAIFHLPLRSFLLLPPSTGRSSRSRGLVESRGSEILDYQFQDMVWLQDRLYRMHSFSHPSSPAYISGLTADIVISAALIATYGLDEEGEANESGHGGKLGYVRRAENQMKWSEVVIMALKAQGGASVGDQRTEDT